MSNPIVLNNWNMGGLSESRILGENDRSLFKMVGTDVHSKIGLLQSNRRLVKESGTTVDGLVSTIVPCSNGNVYLFSSTSGKIWQYSPNDKTYALVYTANSPVGSDYILGACEYDNFLYFATQNYLYRIQLDYTVQNWNTYVEEVGKLNVDPVCGDSGFLGGSGADTDLAGSLSEDAGKWTAFTPQLKTMTGIAVNIKTVPTTSMTFTLHNTANTSIATKTVESANLTTGINEIYWNTPVTYKKGETYHLHVFQTGTGGEVYSAVANNLTNMYLEVYGASNSNYHPMIVLNGILFIGDNNYVHQVENYLVLNALDLPAQYTVKCLGKIGIDLLIGTEVANSVHSAMIFRWNTWSVSWSIEDDIEEQSINAFIPVDNFVYVVAGTRGNVYFYNGEKLELLRRIGGEFDSTDSVKVNPNAVASMHGIPLIGVTSVSGDALETGVYGMGTANPRLFPRIFDMEYVTSQGMAGVEIGAIATFGTGMLVSWRKIVGETITYGVDAFDGTNLYSGAYIQSRVIYRDRNSRTVYRKAIVNYMSIQNNTPRAVTFDPDADTVGLTAHGFQNGEAVKFSVTTGTLPTAIVAGTTYYVINATANTFQVSATEGGSAINIATAGSAVMKVEAVNLIRLYYRKDYEIAWTELTLLHDTDKKQFITQDWGDYAFCLEIKLELRTIGGSCPVIDELTLVDQEYGL